MKTHLIFVLSVLSLAGAGCFDPNQNSQLAPTADGSGGGSSGTNTLGDASVAIPGLPLATFDTTTQGFSFSTYADPNSNNLGATANPGIAWIGTEGSPAPGALAIMAPYSGANQYVDVQSKSYPMTGLQNWTGARLHVRVKVAPGSTFGGQIEPYADTGSNYDFVGTSFNTGQGNDWQEFSVDLASAMTRITGYDLSQVVLFGIHIGTGSGGSSATPVTFYIDSFSIEGAPSATGAAGAGGNGTAGASGSAGSSGSSGSGGAGGARDASAG